MDRQARREMKRKLAHLKARTNYDPETKALIAEKNWLELLHDKISVEDAPKVGNPSADGIGLDVLSPTFVGTKKSVKLTNERTGKFIELTNEEAYDWCAKIIEGGHLVKGVQA
jgi:hypothetical protein